MTHPVRHEPGPRGRAAHPAAGNGAVAARRQRILDAAARCFAKHGFARTRIEDVAAEARVSRALVYHHFGSKEELARQVQEHMLEEWSAAVDQAIASAPSAGDALAAWLRVNLADTRRRPLLHAILADAALLASFEDAARRSMAEWREKLVALLRDGVARGEFRADLDVESAAEVLRAMQVGMMQHLLSERPYVDVSGERHLRAACELLVAGLRHAP
jgi:TetR/AcrR family fatty acid metabolism transcriptional regulator